MTNTVVTSVWTFVDSGEIVPEEMVGWARCGHPADGTDPFSRYIDGRKVVEELPATATEGDTCAVSWAGNSGWYTSAYIWQDGQWVETDTDAPWQMRV